IAHAEGDAEHDPADRGQRRGAQQHEVGAEILRGVVDRERGGQTAQHGDHDAQQAHRCGSLIVRSVLLHGRGRLVGPEPYDRPMPILELTAEPFVDVAADVLVLPLVAGAGESPASVPGSPAISEAVAGLDPSAARGDLHRLPSSGLAAATTLLLVGVGEEDLSAVSAEDLRLAFGAAARSLSGVSRAALALPEADDAQRAAALEGAALGAYAFTAHKTGTGASAPKSALGEIVL